MSCGACSRRDAGQTVTLHDGRAVCTWCPDWKDECLARHVLALPGRERRRAFLEDWGKKHGDLARERLADLVRAVWEARRAEKETA